MGHEVFISVYVGDQFCTQALIRNDTLRFDGCYELGGDGVTQHFRHRRPQYAKFHLKLVIQNLYLINRIEWRVNQSTWAATFVHKGRLVTVRPNGDWFARYLLNSAPEICRYVCDGQHESVIKDRPSPNYDEIMPGDSNTSMNKERLTPRPLSQEQSIQSVVSHEPSTSNRVQHSDTGENLYGPNKSSGAIRKVQPVHHQSVRAAEAHSYEQKLQPDNETDKIMTKEEFARDEQLVRGAQTRTIEQSSDLVCEINVRATTPVGEMETDELLRNLQNNSSNTTAAQGLWGNRTIDISPFMPATTERQQNQVHDSQTTKGVNEAFPSDMAKVPNKENTSKTSTPKAHRKAKKNKELKKFLHGLSSVLKKFDIPSSDSDSD